MKVNGKDDIPYIMENKKYLKPPTSLGFQQHRDFGSKSMCSIFTIVCSIPFSQWFSQHAFLDPRIFWDPHSPKLPRPLLHTMGGSLEIQVLQQKRIGRPDDLTSYK